MREKKVEIQKKGGDLSNVLFPSSKNKKLARHPSDKFRDYIFRLHQKLKKSEENAAVTYHTVLQKDKIIQGYQDKELESTSALQSTKQLLMQIQVEMKEKDLQIATLVKQQEQLQKEKEMKQDLEIKVLNLVKELDKLKHLERENEEMGKSTKQKELEIHHLQKEQETAIKQISQQRRETEQLTIIFKEKSMLLEESEKKVLEQKYEVDKLKQELAHYVEVLSVKEIEIQNIKEESAFLLHQEKHKAEKWQRKEKKYLEKEQEKNQIIHYLHKDKNHIEAKIKILELVKQDLEQKVSQQEETIRSLRKKEQNYLQELRELREDVLFLQKMQMKKGQIVLKGDNEMSNNTRTSRFSFFNARSWMEEKDAEIKKAMAEQEGILQSIVKENQQQVRNLTNEINRLTQQFQERNQSANSLIEEREKWEKRVLEKEQEVTQLKEKEMSYQKQVQDLTIKLKEQEQEQERAKQQAQQQGQKQAQQQAQQQAIRQAQQQLQNKSASSSSQNDSPFLKQHQVPYDVLLEDAMKKNK